MTAADERHDFCTMPPGCGFSGPIARTEVLGRKTIKLCAKCAANPVVLKELGDMGLVAPVPKEPATIAGVVEKTLAQARSLQPVVPSPARALLTGVFLGALMAVSLTILVFKYLGCAWLPGP